MRTKCEKPYVNVGSSGDKRISLIKLVKKNG